MQKEQPKSISVSAEEQSGRLAQDSLQKQDKSFSVSEDLDHAPGNEGDLSLSDERSQGEFDDDSDEEGLEAQGATQVLELESFEDIDQLVSQYTTIIQSKKRSGLDKNNPAGKKGLELSGTQVANPPNSVFPGFNDSWNLVPPHLTSLRFKTYNLYSSLSKLSKAYFKKMNFSKSITFALFDNNQIVISDISGAMLLFNYSSNRFNTLTTKIETHGYPTAIEFSIDNSYIYIGYFMGDIRIVDAEAFTDVQLIAKAIMNPISGIRSLSPTEFIVFDSVGNVFSFEMRRNYFLMTTFQPERLEFFNGCSLASFEICFVLNSDALADRDKGDVLSLACISNKSSVSIYQLKPERKNIELIAVADDQKLKFAAFNSKKYGLRKRIFFCVTTSAALLLYELKKTLLKSGSAVYKSVSILEVDILYYQCPVSQWINDNTYAILTKNCKEIYLFNFQMISMSEASENEDAGKLGPKDQEKTSKPVDIAIRANKVSAPEALGAKSQQALRVLSPQGGILQAKLNRSGDQASQENQSAQGLPQITFYLKLDDLASGSSNVFFQKEVLPETIDFEMAEGMISMKYWIRAYERSTNPSKLNFLDFRGQILEIELRKWRDYFDSELEFSDLKTVLRSFLEVYRGSYSFFNDFIFDQFRRERIMNSYLGDKLKLLFDRKFNVIEENLRTVIKILIEMDNYDFLFYYLRKEFASKGKEDLFEEAIEYFIEHNRIKRMPNQQILELAQRFLHKKKPHLITTFILNLDLYNEKIDELVDFCLANDLYIAAIYLYMNLKPPAVSKLLSILLKRTRKAQESSENLDVQIIDKANEDFPSKPALSIGNLLLWFSYKFLKGELFNRKLEGWLVEAFLVDFYQIFSDEKTMPTVFNVSWKKALLVYGELLNQRGMDYLKAQLILDNQKLSDLFDRLTKTLSGLNVDTKDFVIFYLKLQIMVQTLSEVKDFDYYFEQFLRFTRSPVFVFKEFLSLLRSFVMKFRSAMPEEQLGYFLSQLWENFRTNPTSQEFIRVVIDLYIELEDEKKAFQMIALSPIKIVKGFIFSYIGDKLRQDNQIIKNQFLADFKYFFIISMRKTFALLRLIPASDIPVDQLSDQLNNYNTLQFELYKFLLQTFPSYYKSQKLVMKYFEMMVAQSGEAEVHQFLLDHFDSIELVRGLKVLLARHFYFLVGMLFERTGNPEKAFTFYFLELKRRHGKFDIDSEKVSEIFRRINEVVDKYSNVLQSLALKHDEQLPINKLQRHLQLTPKDELEEVSLDEVQDPLEREVLNHFSEVIYERETGGLNQYHMATMHIPSPDATGNRRQGKKAGNMKEVLKDNVLYFSSSENKINFEASEKKAQHKKFDINVKDDIDDFRLKVNPPESMYSSDIVQGPRSTQHPSLRKLESFESKSDGNSFLHFQEHHRSSVQLQDQLSKIENHHRESFRKKSTVLKDSLDFDRTADVVTIADILDYCRQSGHRVCNSFKSKCLLSFLNSKNLNNLTGILGGSNNLSTDLVSSIFKEISERDAHFNSILAIVNTDYQSEKVGSANGNYFANFCMICKEPILQTKQEDLLVIAKPKCGHIFHVECYQKLKLPIPEGPKESRFQICPICMQIEKILANKDSLNANIEFQDPIIRNIAHVVNPLTSVLKTTSYGLMKLMSTVVTLGGQQEDRPVINESSAGPTPGRKSFARRESFQFKDPVLRRRSSIGRFDTPSKDTFTDWVAQFKHDELASRFERLKNDAEFDLSLVVNDKKLAK